MNKTYALCQRLENKKKKITLNRPPDAVDVDSSGILRRRFQSFRIITYIEFKKNNRLFGKRL